MLTRERIGTITKLSFPITIALSSTLVMSMIDLAMVGTLGNSALAAVGLSLFSNTLILAFVQGTTAAVQGLVARRRGENSEEAKCLPLNGGLLVALAVGIPLTIISYLFSPFFFSLISSNPAVTKIGVPFLRTLYLAIIPVGMNSAFRGFWNGMERPKVHMAVVLTVDCLKTFLNYVLIFGHFGAPVLGAQGAAISTVVALYMGAAINCTLTYVSFLKDGFLSAMPGKPLLIRIVQMALPSTVQEFFFSAGYITFFWMVGQVGTAELAAANVLIRITMAFVLLAVSLGMASATLVSRTVGEGDPEGAARWGWDTGKLGVITISSLGLPLVLFPKFFLSIFLSDPHTVMIASIPLQLTAATAGLGSLIYIFGYTLYSVGDGKRVIKISFGTQWILFLPAVWIVGPYLKSGLLQIWYVQMAYGFLATVLITTIWADGRWKKIKI
jgi:multidrug resistance protein, MATE family